MIKNSQNKGKIIALRVSAFILTIFFASFLFKYIDSLKTDNSQKNLATEIAYIGQGLLRSSGNVLDKYSEDNYRQLTDGRNKLNLYIDILSKGGVLSNGVDVPQPNEYLSGQISAFQSVVNDIIININFIVNEKNDALLMKEKREKYEKLNNKIIENLLSLGAGVNELKITSGDTSQYLSVIGSTYNMFNNVSVKSFADDKNILNEDYLSEQNNILQIINQQVSEIARLPNIVKDFNMPVNIKNNLLSDINKLYATSQELKSESNSLIEIMPKIVTAKKYASQNDKLAVRLEDAYSALSFSLASTNSNSSIWLFSFISISVALFLNVAFLLSLTGRGGDIVEGERGKRKQKELIKSINEAIKTFTLDGKLKRNIQFKSSTSSQINKVLDDLPSLRDLSVAIMLELNDNDGFIREIESDSSNLVENFTTAINEDGEFPKTMDLNLSKIDKIRNIITEIYESSKGANIDTVKSNIEHSTDAISNTIISFNKLRENMQESNKLIKRVSETTQSMNESVDNIKVSAQKMQINALNTQIMSNELNYRTNDPEIKQFATNFESYTNDIGIISSDIIEAINNIETYYSSISKDTAESIRSLESNIQEIVIGGEMIVKIQRYLQSIDETLKNVSRYSSSISENTKESINQLELTSKGLTELKDDNKIAVDKKQKYLLKLKFLHEKLSDRVSNK